MKLKKILLSTCPICHSQFTHRARSRPRRYCSRRCSLVDATRLRSQQQIGLSALARIVAAAMDGLATAGQAGEVSEEDRQTEDPGVWIPTAAQIVAGTEAVQRTWATGEHERRSRWATSSVLMRRLAIYRHNGKRVTAP